MNLKERDLPTKYMEQRSVRWNGAISGWHCCWLPRQNSDVLFKTQRGLDVVVGCCQAGHIERKGG